MRKNPHSKILKREPKEQHLNTVSKSYSILKKRSMFRYGIHWDL